MSIMIVSDPGRFPAIIEKLRTPAISNIHYYNSRMPQGLAGPVLSLLPFVEMVVFDGHAYGSHRLSLLRREARKLKVPCVHEHRANAAILAASGALG